ncbi:hypothetical protein [Gracilimonas amylolytica]|uniref:hypothetical protein n=1 Tax=Gracilimonas amylolytica TaxID=1749045 RepID=UPI000CD7F86B|nr:hypothetical protein [Gracilimonas amylolytica]
MTAQIKETIKYEGRTLSMAAEPLNSYLRNRYDLQVQLNSLGTACRRGYMGEWEVKDDKLYLTNLKINLSHDSRKGVETLFPGQQEVFAEWFTGEVRIPTGYRLQYVHMGYASVYEKDLFLMFEEGKLIDKRIVDNRKSNDQSS